MAADKKRPLDDDPDDLGYEVVENPPPAKPRPLPTAKLLPPLPPGKSHPPRPAPKAPVKPAVEDPGFEVVETGPPSKPKKPKVAVVADDEDEDVLPARKSRHAAADDEDEAPRKKSKRPVAVEDEEDEDEDDEDDRPRKKKGKKKGKKGAGGIDDETNNVLMEWAGPVFLMVAGLVMTCIGTYGIAKHPDFGIDPGLAIMIRVIGEFVSIPVTIVALIFIGSLFGIEYGSITSAIRNLAAMGFLIGGMIDIFDWSGLPFFVYQPVIFLVGVGLFIVLFGLDIFETMVTMFMLNVLSWVFQFIMIILIMALLMSADKKRERDSGDDDEDDRPSIKQKDRDTNRPSGKNKKIDPDDDFDPDNE